MTAAAGHRVLGYLVLAVWLSACADRSQAQSRGANVSPARDHGLSQGHGAEGRRLTRPSDAELRQRLTPLQYQVTQQAGTERPFRNEYWDHHAPGIYVDITTGEPLFSSLDKFDSGTGWPSFSRPIAGVSVAERVDSTHGMRRTEVRSRAGDAHLGHLFDDGPTPTGQRYCINSAALRFVPADRLVEEGYPEYRHLFFPDEPAPSAASATPGVQTPAGPATPVAATREEAILAGGCFWGMEEILRGVAGVLDVEVGYTGGNTSEPSYATVRTGRTGHAEAVRVVFDPRVLSYRELLERWFFRMHDPTTLNRQGNDVGTQYRSAIFFTSDAQRRVAEEAKNAAQRSGRWTKPIVTQIVAAGPFTRAEPEHQDYLQRNPGGYTCHYVRP